MAIKLKNNLLNSKVNHHLQGNQKSCASKSLRKRGNCIAQHSKKEKRLSALFFFTLV